ncbi:MAG TPA: type II toxin-antitoxin system VapC family toxin [Polyangiaceae bacterium]|nr:type II toxin-antitoxin system VapC family toxin [Polyangiaceae bacterium]
MIVVDTNVLSELMRPKPAPSVVEWVGEQAATSLYTTTITQAEVLYGILLLPAGKRRTELLGAAEAMFREDFGARVLPFGTEAAALYARIAADRRRAGRPISHFDAQISAIARACGARVATRNVADFENCGVQLLNPWETSVTR